MRIKSLRLTEPKIAGETIAVTTAINMEGGEGGRRKSVYIKYSLPPITSDTLVTGMIDEAEL